MKASLACSLRCALVLAGLALAVSACTTSRVSGYAGPAAAGDLSGAGKAIQTVAEVPNPHPAPAVTADGYPNINKVPDRPKRKLMTPEETQKVIAELEALAKAQGAPLEKSSENAKAACDDAAAGTLDPEEALKRERDGQKC